MYNCVSQVTYFHNAKYERRMQKVDDFPSMMRGEFDVIHTLPCVLQLFPDIEILFEEDEFCPFHFKESDPEFRWIMSSRRLYLLVKGKGLMYHKNPLVTLAKFCS
jgi:hypothetical protein